MTQCKIHDVTLLPNGDCLNCCITPIPNTPKRKLTKAEQFDLLW